MKNSPPRSPRENRLPLMGEQPQERDQGAMHPRHHQPTNLEPRGDRKAVQDQDLNNPHGATFMSHLFFQRKPSANLYACQDQVSCI
jgi:hypothetical protein